MSPKKTNLLEKDIFWNAKCSYNFRNSICLADPVQLSQAANSIKTIFPNYRNRVKRTKKINNKLYTVS